MIVYGEGLRAWIEPRIGTELPPGSQFLGRTSGVNVHGVSNDALVAVVSFSNYTGDDVELCISALPGGVSRALLRAIARYVYEQLSCTRCTVRARADNPRAIALNERLGFTREGLMRRAHNGVDVILMGMLKEECRYGI